ncbi:MAG: hypothetical protein HFH53_10400 [Hespellia sp.]|jgi:hypothetical protein|nr:hypothetical protein [Hespellia sp.]
MRSNRKGLESRLRELEKEDGIMLPVAEMSIVSYLKTLVDLQRNRAWELESVMKNDILPFCYEMEGNPKLTIPEVVYCVASSEGDEKRRLLYEILILPFCDLNFVQ